jgi:hypothetical protein
MRIAGVARAVDGEGAADRAAAGRQNKEDARED